LVGCLGFEFRLAMQTGDKHLFVGTTVKPSCLVGKEVGCGLCHNLALCTLAIALQLRKNHRKTSEKASKMCSADQR